MPEAYRDIDDCREPIQQYAQHLWMGTDDDDPNLRDSTSTKRYLQDIRWFDMWLDEQEIEGVWEMEKPDAKRLIKHLRDEFSGPVPRYRWDRLMAMYDTLVAEAPRDEERFNPLDALDGKKKQFGLTKTPEQSKHLDEGENYAVSQSEVRKMEEAVEENPIRNQLLIRLMWQTGLRRGEVAGLELRDIDRESREITVRAEHAKNGKRRVVPYQSTLDGTLNKWLNIYRREALSGRPDAVPNLFVGERGAPLSGDAINDVIVKSACNAGINRELDYTDANGSKRWLITAHNLRHGYGNYMVHETDAGLWEISKLMGHASVSVTEDRYIEHDKRAGVKHGHKYGPS